MHDKRNKILLLVEILLVRFTVDICFTSSSSSSSSSLFYLLGKQIQICSRKLHIAGTTRESNPLTANSRPKGNITTTKDKSTNTKYEYKTKHTKKKQTML